MLCEHPTPVAVLVAFPTTAVYRDRKKPLNQETRIMQRWRYMGFAMVALAVLAVPGRLPAQEDAKKGETPKVEAPAGKAAQPPAPAGAAAKEAPPAATEARKPRLPAAAAAPRPAPSKPRPEKPFDWFPFLRDPAYDIWEQIALVVVLLIAIAGLVYAGTAGRPGDRSRRGNRADARGRRGDPAGGQRLPGAAVQSDHLAGVPPLGPDLGHDRERRSGGHRPGRRVLHGGDVLLDGRLRGDEPGGAGQPPRRRGRADQLRRRACNWATAPARSPAC